MGFLLYLIDSNSIAITHTIILTYDNHKDS